MKKITLILFAIVAGMVGVQAQGKTDSWNEFAKTKFEPKYNEKLGEYTFYPSFPTHLKALEGKEITLEGFYVPFAPEDGDYIIVSKYPMSQCFFCGGGGPESIAEVHLAKNTETFQVDDLITVKGKLRLNADNADHLTFILDQASVVYK